MFKTEEKRRELNSIWSMFEVADEIRSDVGRMEAQAKLDAWNKLWSLFQKEKISCMLQVVGEDDEDTKHIRNQILIEFENLEDSLNKEKMYDELIALENRSLEFDWTGMPIVKTPNQNRYGYAHRTIAEAYIKKGIEEIKYGNETEDPRYLENGENDIQAGIAHYEDYLLNQQPINPYVLTDYMEYVEKFDINKLKATLHNLYLDRKKYDEGVTTRINWKRLDYELLSDFIWPFLAYGEAEEIAFVVISFRQYLPRLYDYKDIIEACLEED